MDLLKPIALWGLSGLALPLVIHLLSKKEGRVILFGSVRHLTESITTKSRSIQLNEILLLIIRCMLIVLVVLFVAQLVIINQDQQEKKWLVIEKNVDNNRFAKQLRDSLTAQQYEIHWLADGFPREQDSTSMDGKNDLDYWKLLEQLQATPAEEIIVAAHGYSKGFKHERIAIDNRIQWISIPPERDTFVAWTVQKGDSTCVRSGETAAEITSYTTKMIQSEGERAPYPDTITVSIANTHEFDYDKDILIASLQAVQSITPHIIRITDSVNSSTDWLFSLGQNVVKTSSKTRLIVYRECPAITALLVKASETSCGGIGDFNGIITRRLNESLALEEKFPLQLAELILPKRTFADDKDRTVVDEKLIEFDRSNETRKKINHSSTANTYLAALILITLIAERLLSHKRNQ